MLIAAAILNHSPEDLNNDGDTKEHASVDADNDLYISVLVN